MEDDNLVIEKRNIVPEWLVTVTPLSKYLAMALFVTLPFIGFILGMNYQKAISSVASPLDVTK